MKSRMARTKSRAARVRSPKGRMTGGDRPRVVVKFRDGVQLPYEDGAEKYVERLRVGPWSKLAAEFPGARLTRMFTALAPNKIRELVSRAVKLDETYRPPDFLTFFVVDAPEGVDLERLARALNEWRSVQTAYVDRPGPDPVVNPADDPRWPNQGYLDPAPDGIDAEYAWGFAGGDGAGQRVVDLEQGWTLDHEDLVDHGATLLHGTLLDSSRGHGTSVLGELCAVDNSIGCVGIAPNIDSVDVVSFHGSTRPDAIVAALDSLSFGEMLLLEAQVYVDGSLLGPIECYDADYEAIRLATALGIIVVEAGGNGTNNGSPPPLDMDTYTNGAGLHILFRDPSNPDFRDSGAIIVSAATSASPHTRRDYGPHGQRIDCYAWSQNIDTCSSSSGGATNLYTVGFGGTSGASPIITGAALLVQGMAEAALGYRFGPHQMRVLLSDPATGTPPAATETTHIGVMPNLRAIIDGSILNLAPDIYIRDHVGDTGDPHTGSISASPDIILLPDPVADPQATYGEGSGTENVSTLGSTAEEGQTNYIYVRVRNRGGSNAADVEATVHWAPVATLLTPDLWNPVGSVVIPNVPNGDILTVSDGIPWNSVPAEGHYCFVGLVGNAQDPAPGPAEMLDWDQFYRFIRENNNVTWRNFNVEHNESDPEAGDPAGYVGLKFLATGAPDRARAMQLEFVGKLPEGARLMLEAPRFLLQAAGERMPLPAAGRGKKVGPWLPLNPHGRKLMPAFPFPAKARIPLRLLVHIPENQRRNAYEVFVRQLYKRTEVGRVTWRLVPKQRRRRIIRKRRK